MTKEETLSLNMPLKTFIQSDKQNCENVGGNKEYR